MTTTNQLKKMNLKELRALLSGYCTEMKGISKMPKAKLLEELVEVMTELEELDAQPVKKTTGTKGDCVFVKRHQTEKVSEWRIYRKEGGKDIWMNMKDTEAEAILAGERTATKRNVPFIK
jgi:hypothetical protein